MVPGTLHLDPAWMRFCGRLLGLPSGTARRSVCSGLFHTRGVCSPRLLLLASDRNQCKRVFRTPLSAAELSPLLFRGLLCSALHTRRLLCLFLLSIQPPWL